MDTAHKLWLSGHKVLLRLHVFLHTALHKLAPNMFSGPRMMPMMLGVIPYREVTSAMYRDGLFVAGSIGFGVLACVQLLSSN